MTTPNAPRPRHRFSLPLALALAALAGPTVLSCQTESKEDCKAPKAEKGAEEDAAPEQPAAHPPVEVDSAKPLALDEWRAIKEKSKAAIKISALEERIATLRTFVKEHGDHEELGAALEGLTDALVEQGDFDPAELASLLEQRAEEDEDDSTLPSELVRKYHVKHKLPLESGLKLLALTRTRLGKDRVELEFETDEDTREWRELLLNYRETETHTTEGHLQLIHGNADKALAALGRARELSTNFPKDIAVHNAGGEQVAVLPAGAMDKRGVLEAAAHHALGDDDAARTALSGVVGFLSELDLRELYKETRAALGAEAKGARTIGAAAEPAQDFSLKDLDGNTVTLSKLRGKVVMMTFWATWCGPCKKEMPVLQKFAREHGAKGLEVLAINTDSFSNRSKVGPFIKDHGLELKVLLEDEEQLSAYNYSAIPALYVIDREGRVAHARTGYESDLKEKLESEILPLIEGESESDRELFVVEQAPEGWDVLWKQPVKGGLEAIAIAPPLGDKPGEIGAVGRSGLTRWSATGEASPPKPLSGWNREVRATDLDGNGAREWIVGGWSGLKVLDAEGEVYWELEGRGTEIVGIRDIGGDGFQELITTGEDRVTVMKSVPTPLWKSHKFKRMKNARLDPKGGIVVQADDALWNVAEATGAVTRGGDVPKGRLLGGRARTSDGSHLDYFKGRWDPTPKLEHDIDGDGQTDVVLTKGQGVVAYNAKGEVLLRIRSGDVSLSTGVGDLDGKPGAELAIVVEHYGVVVMGKK